MGSVGLQATEWRVGSYGTERGLMAALRASGISVGTLSSAGGSQFLSIGAGEGGFQAEYLNRLAYGIRFLRFGGSALVLRGGYNFEVLATPHGGTYELGPLVDLGFQSISKSGFVDMGVQSVITVLPAVFTDDSSKRPGAWFSTGPHLAAGYRSLYFEGNIARTERDGELRTEFHFDLCGGSTIVLCSRLHNYRYDDSKRPVTLLALMVGIGDFGPTRQ